MNVTKGRRARGARWARSRLLAVVPVAVGGVLGIGGGLLSASGGIASASSAPTSYQWSGADEAAGGSDNWSDPANWTQDAAPSGTVDVSFPQLDCDSACGNNDSYNDVSGLKVDNFSLGLGPENNEGDYYIQGNAIGIGSVDMTTSGVTSGENGQDAGIDLPMTLLGSESWTIDAENNSNVGFGTITGTKSQSLKVKLPVTGSGNFGGFINFPSINVGPLTFNGGSSGWTNVTGGNFNGTTDEPVTFDGTALFVTGPGGTTAKTTTTDYGPLTVKGSILQIGNGYTGPYGINDVLGNASFNSTTALNVNSLDPPSGSKTKPGVGYPQFKATGTFKLGSAELHIYAGCSDAIGTSYTVVTAKSVTGTFGSLPNDTVFQAYTDGSASCQTSGAAAPYFEIKYTSTAVTVTVVKAPKGSAAEGAARAANAVRYPVFYERAGHFTRLG